jgi:hypothetical protein
VRPEVASWADAAGPWRQLLALLWLRRTMQRSRRWAQPAFAVGGPLALAATLAAGSRAAAVAPPGRVSEVEGLLPVVYLLFFVGAVVAAVASAGGRELVPRAQLVAYPYSPVTDHLGTLLLAPMNLAWILQALGLAFLTGVVAPWGPGLLLTGAVAALWMAACTATAQVLAWLVELVRTARGGIWWLRAGMVLLVAGAVRSATADVLVQVLDRTPTRWVSDAAVLPDAGRPSAGVVAAGALALLAVAAVAAGAWLRTRLERRPAPEQGGRDTVTYPPRVLPAVDRFWADVRVWRRVDWASVSRSPPLRRGLLVLLLVPAGGAVISDVAWPDVPLMTAVVAAAAGMLFGVNAFALDGSGAVWRQTLPVAPRVWVLARSTVLAEVVLLTGGIVTVAAVLGAPGRPTATTVTAVVLSWAAVGAQVVAQCLRWSLDRPYAVELRTPRDSPAPPAAMTGYSAKLVLAASVVGVALTLAARAPSPLWPVVVAIPSLLWSAVSLRRSVRRWEDPLERARVVAVVAAG